MKKFFISLPLVFTLIFSFVVPLGSSASDFIEVPSDFFDWPYSDKVVVCSSSSSFPYNSAEDFQNNGYLNAPFVNFQFYTRHESMDNVYYSYSVYFWFEGPSSELNVQNSGGLYKISSTSSNYFSSGITSFVNTLSESGIDSYQDRQFSHNNDTSGVTDIIYNSNTNSFYYKIDGSWVKIKGLFHNIESNITDFSDKLDVQVGFSPSLKLNIDRESIDSNGNRLMGQDLKMKVLNNSSKPIQFQMYIQPYVNGELSERIFQLYREPDYFYSYNLTNGSDFATGSIIKMCKPVKWFYLNPGEKFEQVIQWSQLPLESLGHYQCIVEAVFNPYDLATEAFCSNDFDREMYVINKENIEVVYSQEFSVIDLFDVPYNPDNKSNGILPNYSDYDRELLDKQWNSFYDENNTFHGSSGNLITDKDSWYNNPIKPSYDNSYNFNNPDSNNYDLAEQTTGYFSMVRTVLSFFPSWFWSMFSFGVLSLVIIGIIKVLK